MRERGAPAEQVTADLLAAAPGDDAWVVDHLRAAAADAQARGAPETAARLLRRALDERAAAPHRAALLTALGTAELPRAPAEGMAVLREARELAPDTPTRVAAGRALAIGHLTTGRPDDGWAELERTPADVPDGEPGLALAVGSELLVAGLISDGEPNGAGLRGRLAGRDEPAGDTPGERLVLAAIARWRTLTGEPAAAAIRAAERALGDGALLRESPDAPVLSMAITALTSSERFDAAFAHAQRAQEDAGARGSLIGLAYARTAFPMLAIRRGRLADGAVAAQALLDASRQAAFAPGLPVALAGFLTVALERGDLHEADALLADQGLDGPLPTGSFFLRYLGTCAGACGWLRRRGRRERRRPVHHQAAGGARRWRGRRRPRGDRRRPRRGGRRRGGTEDDPGTYGGFSVVTGRRLARSCAAKAASSRGCTSAHPATSTNPSTRATIVPGAATSVGRRPAGLSARASPTSWAIPEVSRNVQAVRSTTTGAPRPRARVSAAPNPPLLTRSTSPSTTTTATPPTVRTPTSSSPSIAPARYPPPRRRARPATRPACVSDPTPG